MRFLRYLKNKFLAFCLFLLKDRRNLIIFTGALPIFFMLYLVGVFTTSYFGLSDYFTYRQVKDKDCMCGQPYLFHFTPPFVSLL